MAPMRRISALLCLSSTLAALASAQVSGTVVDDETGIPIAGAVVSVQATDNETKTDEAGGFELSDTSGGVIVAGAKGYFYVASNESEPVSGLELRLEPVPQEDDPYYTFSSPQR